MVTKKKRDTIEDVDGLHHCSAFMSKSMTQKKVILEHYYTLHYWVILVLQKLV